MKYIYVPIPEGVSTIPDMLSPGSYRINPNLYRTGTVWSLVSLVDIYRVKSFTYNQTELVCNL